MQSRLLKKFFSKITTSIYLFLLLTITISACCGFSVAKAETTNFLQYSAENSVITCTHQQHKNCPLQRLTNGQVYFFEKRTTITKLDEEIPKRDNSVLDVANFLIQEPTTTRNEVDFSNNSKPIFSNHQIVSFHQLPRAHLG